MRSTIGVILAFSIVLLLILTNAVFGLAIAAVFTWLTAMAVAAVLILRRPATAPVNRKRRRLSRGRRATKPLIAAPSRANRVIEIEGRPVPKRGDT